MCCLCVEMECLCVPPVVAYLREVIQHGPLESLGLLNHFLMFRYLCSTYHYSPLIVISTSSTCLNNLALLLSFTLKS
jgi:hypothetical protein